VVLILLAVVWDGMGLLEMQNLSQAWWYTAVIPAFRRLRKENHEFQASLGYIVNSRTV
jgi:hypothetical protein